MRALRPDEMKRATEQYQDMVKKIMSTGKGLRNVPLALISPFGQVLLVLTDGEPSDVDVPDPQYLVEDARRAAQQLRRRGTDLFAFGIGEGRFAQLDRIFGAGPEAPP